MFIVLILSMPTELKRHIQTIQSNFDRLEEDYHVKKIGFFGSVAHGRATSKSDLDIVVEFNEPVGFFKFIELEVFLTRLLKRKVDLVTKKALKPTVKKFILSDVVYA